MNKKIVPMLGVAAVFGSLSIFAANAWLQSAAAVQAPDPEPVAAIPVAPQVEFGTIVVASEPLRYGSPLKAGVLSEIPWPKDNIPEGAFSKVSDISDQNRIVLSAVEANEPVLLAKLSGPDGRATLSNKLTRGKQAISIQTDEVAGVSGFITPGDRVDVVLIRSGNVSSKDGEGPVRPAPNGGMVSETVISGARVLTVGQGTDERETLPRVASSVTLEVTPEEARKIVLSRNIGQLSLSLLSASTTDEDVSALSALADKAGDIATAAEPKADQFTEVKVTRGLVGEVYNVPAVAGQPGAAQARQ